jgi:hypothetical protein
METKIMDGTKAAENGLNQEMWEAHTQMRITKTRIRMNKALVAPFFLYCFLFILGITGCSKKEKEEIVINNSPEQIQKEPSANEITYNKLKVRALALKNLIDSTDCKNANEEVIALFDSLLPKNFREFNAYYSGTLMEDGKLLDYINREDLVRWSDEGGEGGNYSAILPDVWEETRLNPHILFVDTCGIFSDQFRVDFFYRVGKQGYWAGIAVTEDSTQLVFTDHFIQNIELYIQKFTEKPEKELVYYFQFLMDDINKEIHEKKYQYLKDNIPSVHNDIHRMIDIAHEKQIYH